MYYRLFHGCTGRAVNGDLIDVTDSKEEAFEVTVIGFRVPYMSWYENIISYKEVE